jgi:hypothetical protein
MIIDNPDACSHFQLDFSLGYCELTTPVSPDVSGGLPRLWIENLYPKSNKVPATTFVSFHFHWPDLTPPFDTVGEYYRVFMDQDPAVVVVGNDTRIVRYDGGARVERYNDGLGFDFPLSFEFEIERVLVY